MSTEELKWSVLAMADADDSLSEEAKLLILGALEGDEMFSDVIEGHAGPIERPDKKQPRKQSNRRCLPPGGSASPAFVVSARS